MVFQTGVLAYRRWSCIKTSHYKQKTRSSGIQAAWQPPPAQETEINIWERLQKAAERCKPKAADSQGMILTLLRLATVLLAVVSWWSTAQGMRDYVFSQAWQANLASFAI